MWKTDFKGEVSHLEMMCLQQFTEKQMHFFDYI